MTHKELLAEARAQLAYLGDDKHTNEIVSAIDIYLAQPNEKEAALLRALEIIAVGDANNPQAQAAEELIALGYWRDIPEAIALAQPISSVEQEPVARIGFLPEVGGGKYFERLVAWKDLPVGASLYTTPPQRKPLTEEQNSCGANRCKSHGCYGLCKAHDFELQMMKLCPYFGKSPARDVWIEGYKAAHGIK